MVKLLSGFEHRKSKNCGSGALWNISRFYKNHYEEHVIFGLGAGLTFFYGGFGAASKSIGGRNPILVEDFFDSMNIDKKWEYHQTFPERKIKRCIDENIPVLARTDLFYLSYFGKSGIHFPGHEIVIVGYEESEQGTRFVVSDGVFEELKIINSNELSIAMNPPENVLPLFPLENYIIPVEKFEIKLERENIIKSIEKVYKRMTGIDNPFVGLKALELFSNDIRSWLEYDDGWWIFRFAYQVIERRGTGGGLFRYMFADFLKEASKMFSGKDNEILEVSSQELVSAANAWREIAYLFKDISEDLKERKRLEPDKLKKAGELGKTIYQKESKVLETLQELLL